MKIQAGFAGIEKAMATANKNVGRQDRVELYQKQSAQLRELNNQIRLGAAASGNWNVQTVKTISSTEAFTNKIRQQKLGLGELTRSWGKLNEAAKEQISLRNSMAMQVGGNMFGKQQVTLMSPKGINAEYDKTRVKMGLINQAIASAATQTINWGKNTQWAGRQITVGLTMPLGMAAVGAAALALEVDKNLTRIAKVYDTTATDAMGQERELAQLREDSLTMATNMAKEYGASMQDVLDIEAQLASTGLNGRDLLQATGEATRIATLGELDYQSAIDMTIALQTAFKLSNEELTDSFNFMNSVENATSLSIQDIAEATPRAASALSALGGTVQDMTVMLVAMRESGVDAAEGANALKSATSRLLNPTAAAVSYFQETFGIDLKKVVDDAGGNIYTIMQNLAGMTDGYDQLAKQRGIQELFGTYQFNRVTALWDNLGDAMTGTMNQTAQAMEVAGQTTEEWSDVASTEVKRWQDSIQGKFRVAVEGIKAELIPLGMTVLQVITPVMNAISGLISWFNSLSDPVQGTVLWMLGIAAVAGPLLMLVGIFANLFGNMTKFGTNLANLRLKFKAMNSEEAASILMQKQMTSKFDAEARSAGMMATVMAGLTKEIERNAVAEGLRARINASGTATMGLRTAQMGRDGISRYTPGSISERGNRLDGMVVSAADNERIKQAGASTETMAKNAEKTRRSFVGSGQAAGALGVAAIGMGVFADQSDKTNQSITGILMGASLIATIVGPGIGDAFKKIKDNTAAGNSNIKMMGATLASFGRTALRILGPVGIIAGGLALIISFVSSLNDAEEAARQLNNTSSLWAEHMGYDEIDLGENSPFLSITEQASQGAAALLELAAAGNAAAESVVNAARGINSQQELMSLAISQGVQAYNSGASTEDAQQVMREVLELGAGAAALTPVQLDALQLEIGNVDLANPEQLTEAISTGIGTSMDTALNTQQQNIGDRFANWFLTNQVTGSVSEWVSGVFGLDAEYDNAVDRTTDDFTAALLTLTGNLNQLMASAATDFQKNELFDDVQVQFHNSIRDQFRTFNDAMETEFSQQDFDYFREVYEEMGNLDGLDLDLDDTQLRYLESLYDNQSTALRTMIQDIGDANGWTQKQIDDIRTLAQLQRALIPPTISSADAQNRYAQALKGSVAAGKKMSASQHVNLVDSILLASGLDVAAAAAMNLFGPDTMNILKRYLQEAKQEAEGLGGAIRGAKPGARGMDTNPDPNSERNLKKRTEALEAENDAIDAAGEAREKGIQAAGDARSKAIEAQGKAQDKAFDAQSKAEDKAFEAQGKAQDKAFEDRENALESHWDSIEKMTKERHEAEEAALEGAYDGRKKVIEDQIEAEEKAEEIRQKIFEAEEKRIARIAARENRNIDFNAAINSGDLDTAAKIYNDAMAAEAGWSLEDAAAGANDASKDRTKNLQDQIADIETEKDARLDALKEVQEAEDEANKNRREAAKDQLSLEKEIAKEQLDAARDAASERLDAAREAASEANSLASEAASNATEAALESSRAATEAAHEAAQARFDAESLSTTKLLNVRKDEATVISEIGKATDEEMDKGKRKKQQAYKEWIAKQQRWTSDNDIKEQERGGRLGTYGQALEIDKHMVATKKKYKALADYYADQTDIGAESGRVNATGRINKFKTDTETTYRNIGITLGNEQGVGAEKARISIAQKIEAARQDAAIKFGQMRDSLDTNVTTGAERARNNTKAKMQGMVYGDSDSMNQKFAWAGGQLAAHLHNGAQMGRDRSMAWVDWPGAGNDIGGKIAGTVGLDVGGLRNWLKTGDYPGANWKKALSKHDGGVVLHGGGSPDWSSKDRTGVPRSASLYPSEVPAILKRGEFVVNEKATRANLGTLEQINSGKPVQMPHGPAVVRHEGGMWAPGAVSAVAGHAMAEMTANKTLQAVEMLAKIQSEKLRAAAAGGGGGGGDGGAFTPGGSGGGGGNGVFRTTNRNFPAARQNVLSSNTAAAKNFVLKSFPGVGSIGTLGERPNKSDHPMGKAIDNMIPNYRSAQGIKLGTAIADWFTQNPNVFGTKYVIWRDRIAESNGKGWKPYGHPNGPTNNDTLQHRDHPHVSFYHKGGQAGQEMGGFNLPQLNTGGFIKYDNTMANLHKDESVLTAPLTEKFKSGLDSVANGGNDSYTVSIDLRGAYIKEEVDIEAAVERVIDRKEYKNGRRRVV